jgi:hypothetical protein
MEMIMEYNSATTKFIQYIQLMRGWKIPFTGILILFSSVIVVGQSDSVRLSIPKLKKIPVASQTYHPESNISYLTLANGVRIALRPMVGREGSHIDSSIYIRAESVNRKGQYAGSDKINVRIGGYLIRYAGVANLDHEAFDHFLKEHKTYFESNGSQLSLGISLQTYPNHLNEAFQAIYAFYTEPRSDYKATRFALDELIKRYRQRPDTSLESITSDSLRLVLARKGSYLEATDLEKAVPKRAVRLYKKRLSNAQDFIFTIVGAYSLEQIIPLIQLYLGNLPTSKVSNRPTDDDGSFPDPRLKRTIYLPNISTAVINQVFLTNYEQVEEGQNNLDEAYTSVLSSRIKKKLDNVKHRDERVLVLKQPGEILNMTRSKNRQVGVLVKLYCSPARVDSLVALVRSEMEILSKEPVSEGEMDSFKQRGKKNNDYFQTSSYMWSLVMWGSSFGSDWPMKISADREQLLKKITPEALQQTARRYASTKDIIELIFLPTSTR